jgi:hypothetical protein
MMAPNGSLKGRKAPANGDGPRDRSAAAIRRRPGSPPAEDVVPFLVVDRRAGRH